MTRNYLHIFALTLAFALLAVSADAARRKTAHQTNQTGFWASNRDEWYHQSGCRVARPPSGDALVKGTERELIALGYFPDPDCLPRRKVATLAGRIVKVEGQSLQPVSTTVAAAPTSGEALSLGPIVDRKPPDTVVASPPSHPPAASTVPPTGASEETKPPAATAPKTERPGSPPPPEANEQPKLSYERDIYPVVRRYCLGCHGARGRGGITLGNYRDEASVRRGSDVWFRVARVLRSGRMPPRNQPQPRFEDRVKLVNWIESTLSSGE